MLPSQCQDKPSVLKDKGPGPSYSELGLHRWHYLLNAPHGPEAPASPLGSDDLCFGVQPLCEALVLTANPSRAHLRVTLILRHPVQTLRLQATRVFIRRLAVTAGNLRQVGYLDWDLSYYFVSLGEGSARKGKSRWASWRSRVRVLYLSVSWRNEREGPCLFTTPKC